MEEDRGDPEAAAGVLGSALEEHVLPIMHWEALSLRIAELEKQEKEKRERAKSVGVVEEENFPEDRCQVLRGEKEEDVWRAGRVPAVASRFYSPKNLQLCFINNTESDEEDEEEDKSSKERHSKGEETSGGRTPGLKQEVRAALKALRDKLWAEQRENEHLAPSETAMRRTQLELSYLQECSVLQLGSLRASLSQDIHDLSSDLVALLLIRDHLRIKQDAMLLDVQDMTSL